RPTFPTSATRAWSTTWSTPTPTPFPSWRSRLKAEGPSRRPVADAARPRTVAAAPRAPAGYPDQAGIEGIAQAFAHQVERQHRQQNGRPGEKAHPPRLADD